MSSPITARKRFEANTADGSDGTGPAPSTRTLANEVDVSQVATGGVLSSTAFERPAQQGLVDVEVVGSHVAEAMAASILRRDPTSGPKSTVNLSFAPHAHSAQQDRPEPLTS